MNDLLQIGKGTSYYVTQNTKQLSMGFIENFVYFIIMRVYFSPIKQCFQVLKAKKMIDFAYNKKVRNIAFLCIYGRFFYWVIIIQYLVNFIHVVTLENYNELKL